MRGCDSMVLNVLRCMFVYIYEYVYDGVYVCDEYEMHVMPVVYGTMRPQCECVLVYICSIWCLCSISE